MSAALAESTSADVTSSSPLTQHAYCTLCWPDLQPGAVAQCGHVKVIPGTSTGAYCVVCEELFEAPCPTCGLPA